MCHADEVLAALLVVRGTYSRDTSRRLWGEKEITVLATLQVHRWNQIYEERTMSLTVVEVLIGVSCPLNSLELLPVTLQLDQEKIPWSHSLKGPVDPCLHYPPPDT